MDALVHAIEAFVSNAHSPVTDLHALEAVRLLAANLVPSLADPNNLELRSQIMLGSLEAGLAFSNASLGIVHAMAHSLGGFLDLPHGQCNAILLSHAIDFNFAAATERFQRLGAALGLDLKGKTLAQQQVAIREAILQLKTTLGIDQTLGQVGVHASDIPELAKKALNDACLVTNPRRPTQRDIEVLYEEAI
jgi:alcohol dehydrogenase class IV